MNKIYLLPLLCMMLPGCSLQGAWDAIQENLSTLQPEPEAAEPLEWDYRRRITIDNTGQSASFTDFPVLVILDSGRIDYSAARPGGEDIRFLADNESRQLAYEIEKWNPGGTSYIWVKIPGIQASSSAGYFWMYYGCDEAADGQNPPEVWTDHFAGVWHLSETSGTIYLDSTGGGHHGITDDGTYTEPDPAPIAVAGGGQSFVESSDCIIFPPFLDADLGPVTFSFWVNCTAFDAGDRILNKDGIDLWLSSTGRVNFQINFDDGNPVTSNDRLLVEFTNEYGLGSWRWYCFTWDGSNLASQAKVYRNGAERTGNRGVTNDGTGSYTGDKDAPIYFNNVPWGNTGATTGIRTEFRISTVVRGPEWIKAQYLSMTDAYLLYGPEEAQ